MTAVSVKLFEDLVRDVATEARRRGISKSPVIRDELQARLRRVHWPRTRVACADLVGDLIGSLTGSADLSTNPRYLDEASLDEASGEDALRGRRRHRPHR